MSARTVRVVAPGIAIVATIAAVIMAVVRRGAFDPNLAILTATLIAIIWYTYLTYLAVTKEEPVVVLLDLEYDQGRGVRPKVTNGSYYRTLKIEVRLQLWFQDQELIDVGRHYTGESTHELGPLAGFGPWLPVPTAGTPQRPLRNHRLNAIMTANWTDDLGRTGKAGPRYWIVDTDRQDVVAVPSEEVSTPPSAGLSA